MTEIILGSDGYIGGRLGAHLPDAIKTTRIGSYLDGRWPLDLTHYSRLPEGDIVYFCAGINGAKKCEGNNDSYAVNVDATLKVIREYTKRGTFVVWISSRSIEWAKTDYARHKQVVECALWCNDNVGIVRAGRVTGDNIDALCHELILTGKSRKSGLTVWGSDDVAYERKAA